MTKTLDKGKKTGKGSAFVSKRNRNVEIADVVAPLDVGWKGNARLRVILYRSGARGGRPGVDYLIDMRLWLSGGGKWIPTKTGIRFHAEHGDQIAAMLSVLCSSAKAMRYRGKAAVLRKPGKA